MDDIINHQNNNTNDHHHNNFLPAQFNFNHSSDTNNPFSSFNTISDQSSIPYHTTNAQLHHFFPSVASFQNSGTFVPTSSNHHTQKPPQLVKQLSTHQSSSLLESLNHSNLVHTFSSPRTQVNQPKDNNSNNTVTKIASNPQNYSEFPSSFLPGQIAEFPSSNNRTSVSHIVQQAFGQNVETNHGYNSSIDMTPELSSILASSSRLPPINLGSTPYINVNPSESNTNTNSNNNNNNNNSNMANSGTNATSQRINHSRRASYAFFNPNNHTNNPSRNISDSNEDNLKRDFSSLLDQRNASSLLNLSYLAQSQRNDVIGLGPGSVRNSNIISSNNKNNESKNETGGLFSVFSFSKSNNHNHNNISLTQPATHKLINSSSSLIAMNTNPSSKHISVNNNNNNNPRNTSTKLQHSNIVYYNDEDDDDDNDENTSSSSTSRGEN
jgi:hypothetical protein